MELTLVGGFVIAIGFWLSMASHERLVQSIVFFASFSGTAVLNFGEYGMAPDVVLLSFLLLASVLSGRLVVPARISGDHLTVGFLILVFTSIVGLSSLFNGAAHGLVSLQVTQTVYLLFGVCLTLVLSVEFATVERLEAGLTPSALAEKVGVVSEVIANLEEGKIEPQTGLIELVASAARERHIHIRVGSFADGVLLHWFRVSCVPVQ